jgi:hypothetical protein
MTSTSLFPVGRRFLRLPLCRLYRCGGFHTAVPVIETLHNKANFVRLCEDLGLATPKTAIATSKESLQAAVAESLGEAILGTSNELRFVDVGLRRQLDDAYPLVGPGRKLKGRALVRELLSTPDAVLSGHDILPAFYCLINRRHFFAARRPRAS